MRRRPSEDDLAPLEGLALLAWGAFLALMCLAFWVAVVWLAVHLLSG